jgi:hypothetical protein
VRGHPGIALLGGTGIGGGQLGVHVQNHRLAPPRGVIYPGSFESQHQHGDQDGDQQTDPRGADGPSQRCPTVESSPVGHDQHRDLPLNTGDDSSACHGREDGPPPTRVGTGRRKTAAMPAIHGSMAYT